MGKRHLTRNEIIAKCKAVARERRMCERSPWTAASIICGYALMRSEGFGGEKISKIVNRINEFQEEYEAGRVDLDQVSRELYEKADWTISCEDYTEADIRAKKGTFDYWLDQKQIDPQNAINRNATRYMLFFFKALNEVYGYGKKRLTRVQEKINEYLELYQQDKTSVSEWKKALFEEAGIYFEDPIDPLTQKRGSMMTGGCDGRNT